MWVQLGAGAEQPIHASAEAPLFAGVWGCAPELAHPLASGFRSKHTGLGNEGSSCLCRAEQISHAPRHAPSSMFSHPGVRVSLTPQHVGRCLALSRPRERFFQ